MPCRIPLFSLLLLAVSGCASTHRGAALPSSDSAAEAARARYRAIQAAQKPIPVSSDYEVVPLARPERTEDGIIRNSTTDYVRILRLP